MLFDQHCLLCSDVFAVFDFQRSGLISIFPHLENNADEISVRAYTSLLFIYLAFCRVWALLGQVALLS